MELFRRLDRAWARGEGVLTVGVLLSMVFVASFSAAVRNLTRFDLDWANALLTDMEWADSFLRKGTMWLAFLGASQATYYRKHISIDVVTRMLSLRPRYLMQAAAGICAGLITFALAISLASAVRLNLSERPLEYELIGDSGGMHICDATVAQRAALKDVERPWIFCLVRSGLAAVGVPAEAPGAAFQLIVPLMFFVIGLRFTGFGIAAAVAVAHGDEALQHRLAEDEARLMAVRTAASGELSDAEQPT